MANFADMVAADGALFVDPTSCPGVEAVTYKPFGAAVKPINVNVLSRMPPDVAQESGRGRNWHVTVFVRNHATLGVTSINQAGDIVSIAPQFGGAAADLSVIEIMNQSAAGWTLLLR